MSSFSKDPTEVSSDSEAKELAITPVSIASGSPDKVLGIPWLVDGVGWDKTQSDPSLTGRMYLIITTKKRSQSIYKRAIEPLYKRVIEALLVNSSPIRNETEETTSKGTVGGGPTCEPQVVNKLIKLYMALLPWYHQ